MRESVKRVALAAKGFLSAAEGMALFRLAAASANVAPCLEIGSYCGRSTLFLAEGCRLHHGHKLFAVDHHKGSLEQQPGQPYHDPALYDVARGVVTTLPSFLANVCRADLLPWVIPVLADSQTFASRWGGMVSLVFIDGSHVPEDVFMDYFTWGARVLPGGYLCIHDIYATEADGGQAPRQMMEFALATRRWELADQVDSLGVLRRYSG